MIRMCIFRYKQNQFCNINYYNTLRNILAYYNVLNALNTGVLNALFYIYVRSGIKPAGRINTTKKSYCLKEYFFYFLLFNFNTSIKSKLHL